MKKSDELRQEITAKKELLDNLEKEFKFADAVKAADEICALCDKLKIESAKEKAEFENFKRNCAPATNMTEDAAKLRSRAFNKLVINPLRILPEPLTDEEKNAYFNLSGSPGQPALVESINTQGGYLVPTEQMATLQIIEKKYIALKEYVRVVSVNHPSGMWPVYKRQTLRFRTVAEMTAAPEGTFTFSQANYTVEDRMLILPVSNQLIADSSIDIVSHMGNEIAVSAIETENEKILEPLAKLITGDSDSGIAEAPTITSYKSLNTALFKTLDGIYSKTAKIFTNQEGFDWLNNLEDAHNRPLLVPDVTNPESYFYRGKEIVVIPDRELPNTTINNKAYAPFFIGDMYSYLALFERQGLELSTSKELYYKYNGLGMRGIMRFGTVVTDPDAMTALKVEV